MTKSVGRSRVTRVLTTGCLAVLFVWGVATTAAAQQWVAAWGSSLQGPSPDEWAISNATIRLMARSTVAGDRVRVRLENTYGEGFRCNESGTDGAGRTVYLLQMSDFKYRGAVTAVRFGKFTRPEY